MMSAHVRSVTLAVAFAIATLGLNSAPQPKSTAPTPAQLQAQIDALRTRLEAAEKAGANAAMEKDYLERIQKECESYYEKAFTTQVSIVSIISLFITLLLWIAARFSFRVFDDRTNRALKDATTELRREYASALAAEVRNLKDTNAADIERLRTALTDRNKETEMDLTTRSSFAFAVNQGQAAMAAHDFDEALDQFRFALQIYKDAKPRHLFRPEVGATTLVNILSALHDANPLTHEDAIKKHLANPLYDGLKQELALAAAERPQYCQAISERIKSSSSPSEAPEPPQ